MSEAINPHMAGMLQAMLDKLSENKDKPVEAIFCVAIKKADTSFQRPDHTAYETHLTCVGSEGTYDTEQLGLAIMVMLSKLKSRVPTIEHFEGAVKDILHEVRGGRNILDIT